MTNVGHMLDGEPWSEQRLKSEISHCAGPCIISAFGWLIVGACLFPILAKHGLRKYVGFESRLLIANSSAILTSFYMGYHSKIKCEDEIKRLYAEEKKKELKNENK